MSIFDCITCYDTVAQWTRAELLWDDELHLGGKSVSEGHPLMDLGARDVVQNTMTVGNLTIRYAYISQKGYYPTKPDHWNQDTCCVLEKFDRGSDHPKMFAGVFDGHGRFYEGQLCSKRTKETLPLKLLEAMKQKRTLKSAFVSAFEATNRSLIRELGPKSNESGSSALAMVLTESNVTVSNCGDSRGLLGRQTRTIDGDLYLQPIELSKDHKPFRKDEIERIVTNFPNTEILTFGMQCGEAFISDEFGQQDDPAVQADPPRVWFKGKGYPGCVYTRSIGDAIAKQAGVIATPEVLSINLTPEDTVIALCSDGITEFLSNADVMNICDDHDDPLDACEELIQTAFKMYHAEDGRSDDITAIVFYLERNGGVEIS